MAALLSFPMPGEPTTFPISTSRQARGIALRRETPPGASTFASDSSGLRIREGQRARVVVGNQPSKPTPSTPVTIIALTDYAATVPPSNSARLQTMSDLDRDAWLECATIYYESVELDRSERSQEAATRRNDLWEKVTRWEQAKLRKKGKDLGIQQPVHGLGSRVPVVSLKGKEKEQEETPRGVVNIGESGKLRDRPPTTWRPSAKSDLSLARQTLRLVEGSRIKGGDVPSPPPRSAELPEIEENPNIDDPQMLKFFEDLAKETVEKQAREERWRKKMARSPDGVYKMFERDKERHRAWLGEVERAAREEDEEERLEAVRRMEERGTE
ncbi:hypothetical protein P7C70_g5213, partial [Phenoliferia sp. Uapishka_3]